MDKANAFKLAIVIAGFSVAGAITYSYFANAEPPIEEHFVAGDEHWLCQNETCEHDFSFTEAEARERIRSGMLTPECPQCNEGPVFKVFRCEHCNEPIMPGGHGARPETCPHCSEPLGGP